MPNRRAVGRVVLLALGVLIVGLLGLWVARRWWAPGAGAGGAGREAAAGAAGPGTDTPVAIPAAAGGGGAPVAMPPGLAVGSVAWFDWLRSLPRQEQSAVLMKIEATMYPGAASAREWKAARVAPGPGSGQGDVFPCKVLTNYKPLLRPRRGLGVTGLQFLLNRKQGSILTTIWGANTKGAILVDWTNGKIAATSGMDNAAGIGVCPEYVPDGILLFGGNGELCFGSGPVTWRDRGYSAYPLALNADELVWFGSVFREQPRELESLVCVCPKPAKILGEIKMPPAKTHIWCLYDPQQKLLLVVEHEWNWIALIDFASDAAVVERATATPKPPAPPGK